MDPFMDPKISATGMFKFLPEFPVEIMYTIYRKRRKNLKNYNFYKRGKAIMLDRIKNTNR